MSKFEKEGFYVIEANVSKNRLYLAALGAWQSPDQVPDYLNHIRTALSELKKGFTCLTYIDDDKPPKLSITRLQTTCMNSITHAGVGQTAVVIPKGKILQKMSLSVMLRLTGMKLKMFEDREEADKWLDENT
jgi:hypothetical protein